MHFILIAVFIFIAFGLGVWLAPIVRADYGEFKAWLQATEHSAKDKALGAINKL